MSQRDLIRMSHDEVADLVNDNSRAYVATLNEDGSPHVVPITYVVLDRRLTFWTDKDSRKARNLERDPRVAAVVDTGTDFQELQGAQLAGVAELIDDAETSKQVAELFVAKVPDEYKEMARASLLAIASERVVVSVTPDRIASWDHRKLAGVRPQDIGH